MSDFATADVELVNVAWKNATCHHFREGVCVSCGSVAILRALDAAGRLAHNDINEAVAVAVADFIEQIDDRDSEIKALREQLAGRDEAIERHHAEEARLARHVDALETQLDGITRGRGVSWPPAALPQRVPGKALERECGWIGIKPMTDPALEDRTEGEQP